MAFRARLKVCFGDIDNAGIVYYPRFLHYFHVALEDFFSDELDIPYASMMQRFNVAFPTVHLEGDFRRPLRFGDQIEVEVRVLNIGKTSITWGYTTVLGGSRDVVVEGHNITVCMNMTSFKKTKVPEWLRKKLLAYQAKCDADLDVIPANE